MHKPISRVSWSALLPVFAAKNLFNLDGSRSFPLLDSVFYVPMPESTVKSAASLYSDTCMAVKDDCNITVKIQILRKSNGSSKSTQNLNKTILTFNQN